MKKLICVLLAWAMLLTAVPTIEAQAATKISKPLITSVAESSGAKVTIKWKKNKSAKGYVIYRKTGKNGKYKKLKTIANNKTVKYVDTSTKDNTTYYYAVRAYKGKAYSEYSSGKKIKTSKSPVLGDLQTSCVGIIANQKSDIKMSVKVKNHVRVKNKTLRLYAGEKIVGYLLDDGKKGDEKANDGIFSCLMSVQPDAVEDLNYTLKNNNKKVESITVKVFDEPTEKDFNNIDTIEQQFKQMESPFASDGYVNLENIDKVIDEAYTQAASLQKEGKAIYVNKNESGVTIQLESGLWYCYMPKQFGVEGGGNTAKLSVWTMQPCCDSLGTDVFDNIAGNIAGDLSNCSFDYNLDDSNVGLNAINHFSTNQIIIWNGHGGYNEKLGPYSVTGEPYVLIGDVAYPDEEMKKKYVAGEIIFCGGGTLGITSRYITNNVGNMDNSFVYIGTCLGAKDSRLMDAYIEKGATVLAFDNTVKASYDRNFGTSLFNTMCEIDEDTQCYYTISKALEVAKREVGSSDLKYSGKGAEPKIKGNLNYKLSDESYATLELSKKSISLDEGKTTTVSAETNVLNKNNIKWKLLQNGIATLSDTTGDKITITGKKAGKVTLQCTVAGKTSNCEITVKEKEIKRDKLKAGSYSFTIKDVKKNGNNYAMTGEVRIDSNVTVTSSEYKKFKVGSSYKIGAYENWYCVKKEGSIIYFTEWEGYSLEESLNDGSSMTLRIDSKTASNGKIPVYCRFENYSRSWYAYTTYNTKKVTLLAAKNVPLSYRNTMEYSKVVKTTLHKFYSENKQGVMGSYDSWRGLCSVTINVDKNGSITKIEEKWLAG